MVTLTPEQQILALLFAGSGVPFVVNFFKAKLKLEGKPALYIAYATSLVAGIVVAFATGAKVPLPGDEPIGFITAMAVYTGLVFQIATLVYKTWLSKA